MEFCLQRQKFYVAKFEHVNSSALVSSAGTSARSSTNRSPISTLGMQTQRPIAKSRQDTCPKAHMFLFWLWGGKDATYFPFLFPRLKQNMLIHWNLSVTTANTIYAIRSNVEGLPNNACSVAEMLNGSHGKAKHFSRQLHISTCSLDFLPV